MRRIHNTYLLLCALVISFQTAYADGIEHVVINETFNTNEGTGGHDGQYSGNIALNDIKYDNDDWTDNKVKGAYQCLKFGTSNAYGYCSTPALELIDASKTATLTFSAAGWEGSDPNKLIVTAEGADVSGDTDITLVNSTWNNYTVTITNASGEFTLTFNGKRGFLDDVRVVETVTTLSAPNMTESCTFFANTTEEAKKHITIAPAAGTTVRYTTDGSAPSSSVGTLITNTTSMSVTATTTVKAIAFYESLTSAISSETYTLGATVNSINAFKALAEGTEARLYLSAEQNARVLHLNNKKCYLRDNTGAICLDFNTVATFNPTPAHNQHVAGWIVGKYQTINNMPTFVATENTNTEHIAFAAPVMEAATEPVAIENSEINGYRNDWVRIENVRVPDSNAGIADAFNVITGTPAYDGALVDVSGIVTASNTVSPVSYNSIKPLVYVIDEDEDFVSPARDISGATVRLKRTLSSSNWNTFAVPLNITTMSGQIREFDHMDGNTMKFKDAANIEAGKPYLIKPTANVVNPVYEDVTLSAASAQTITDGGFSYVATYSPKQLATDKTEQFLKSDGKLYYPTNANNHMKGMRAFFRVPAGASAHIAVDDETTDIISTTNYTNFTNSDDAWYDLQGRRMTNGQSLNKGLYIVNGKKMVIK